MENKTSLTSRKNDTNNYNLSGLNESKSVNTFTLLFTSTLLDVTTSCG